MQEILHAFGIDWRLIVIQIFNFGVLAGVLWYFLYKPVLKILNEREAKIKKGIEDADAAGKARADADTEKNVVLKEAHKEAGEIVARGTQHAEEKGRAVLEEAREKAMRDLKNAEIAAQELKDAARKESDAEIAKLAILGAEKVLNAELSK